MLRQFYLLMDKAGDDKGAGGGSDDKGPDVAQQLKDMQSMNAKLLERLDALEKKGAGGKDDKKDDENNDDLATQARKKREADEAKSKDHKRLASAIKFITTSKDWLKNNETLLPKSIPGIFEAAEKQNYADDIEKDSDIKVGLVSEFFAQQSNHDLLTESQKSVLADFVKLTKNSKQEKVQPIYESIFEPTFEMLKKIKKAEQVSKGLADNTSHDQKYKEKLMKGSRHHHLGEKQ